MRIVELKSENFKKIKAIDITPKEDLVIISGKNAQGKTSILDTIWTTLKSKAIPEKPIREGEIKAENELKLGEGNVVKYIVKRSFTEKGDYLTITNAEGARFPSPQKMLDEFVGDLSFDPLEFTRLKDKPQQELLLKAVRFKITSSDLTLLGLGGDVPANPLEFLKSVRGEYYQERTVINRNLLNLEEQLKAIPEVKATERVSAGELFNKKQQLQSIKDNVKLRLSTNKAREADAQHLLEQKEKEGLALQNYTIRKENEIKEYIATQKKALEEYTESKDQEITKIEEARKLALEDVKVNTAKINLLQAANPDLDKNIETIDTEIQEIDARNEQASLFEKRSRIVRDYGKIKIESTNLTTRLAKIDELKTRIITTTKMPIEGLMFDGEVITYNKIPLSQLSDSEKLKISLAIAIALNPKLKIVRIQDGSLLDSDNMKVLKEVARENDFQIWIERLDESGKVGFFIVEGEVIYVDGKEVPSV